MKVLLTGATGFIGKALGKALAQRGDEIHILTRSAKGLRDKLPFPAKIFEWDPENSKLPLVALDGVEAVINLAGTSIASHRWTDQVKESILTSRLMSLETLWSAIQKSQDHNIHSVISVSAVGFYGDSDTELFTEESQPGHGFLAEVCNRWEKSLFKGTYDQREDIRKVAIRIGVVLGAQGGALKKILPIFKSGLGGVIGSGRQWMSWIHIDDLVGIFLLVLENSKISGVINAVAPKPVTNRNFTHALSRVLHRPAILPVPGLVLKLALGEMSEVLLLSQRVACQKILTNGYTFKFENLEPALKNILSS